MLLCNKDKQIKCRSCDRKLAFRACPFCKNMVPASMCEKPLFIAVTGATGSGKSRYIQAVVEQLRKLSEIFKWTLIQQESTNDRNTVLRIQKSTQDKGKLLVLVEAGGEELTPALMSTLAGVICLVDPLQSKDVRAAIETQKHIPLPPYTGESAQAVLSRLGRQGALVPLAITLAKMDTIITSAACSPNRWFFNSNECMVCRDSSLQSTLVMEELETINCEIESWLTAVYPQDFTACRPFEKRIFLGCSSENPALRTEDALLWVLYQNKIINAR